MPDPKEPTPLSSTDENLRRFREYVAAAIAGAVVLGAIIIFGVALSLTTDQEQFSRVKDILLIINPLLGVVLGYYFNKVSTEARAENAENTAKTAVENAQSAAKARDTAETKATVAETKAAQTQNKLETTQQEAREMKSALEGLSRAAEKVLSQAAPAATTRVRALEGMSSDEVIAAQPYQEMEQALERARSVAKTTTFA